MKVLCKACVIAALLSGVGGENRAKAKNVAYLKGSTVQVKRDAVTAGPSSRMQRRAESWDDLNCDNKDLITLIVELTTDPYYHETTYQIYDPSQDKHPGLELHGYSQSFPYEGTLGTEFGVCRKHCYNIELRDSYGDGLSEQGQMMLKARWSGGQQVTLYDLKGPNNFGDSLMVFACMPEADEDATVMVKAGGTDLCWKVRDGRLSNGNRIILDDCNIKDPWQHFKAKGTMVSGQSTFSSAKNSKWRVVGDWVDSYSTGTQGKLVIRKLESGINDDDTQAFMIQDITGSDALRLTLGGYCGGPCLHPTNQDGKTYSGVPVVLRTMDRMTADGKGSNLGRWKLMYV